MRAAIFFLLVLPVAAQTTVSGSLRTRTEAWDWFDSSATNQYTFQGSTLRFSISQSRTNLDWQFELAAPLLLGLPDTAVGTGAQGQLGMGASYFVTNNRNTNAAMIFPRQGFLRFKNLFGSKAQSFKLGRMEFVDGAEVSPKDPVLAALKRDRIAHRLLGNFGFTHVGRTYDGAQYAASTPALNFTALAARPTRGVFRVDGWGDLNTYVFYGALTGAANTKHSNGEFRLFGLGYYDGRDNVLKTDNRPLAARRADTAHLNIATFGGHYIHAQKTAAGTLDGLFWGAAQAGSWGQLAQRAYAYALEAGFQPEVLKSLKPWFRFGYNYGSGDNNPNDSTHGAFFQVLPTPRIYARMPFFNLMNSRDAFAELILRPAKPLTVRADIHSVRLANSNDLWYSGGGAYEPWTFGYTGRASSGAKGLATLFDVSADYAFNAHFSAGVYYAHVDGKSVVRSIYPAGNRANLGFLELTYKF